MNSPNLNIPPVSQVSDADLATIAAQLGREPRGVLEVAARCACGAPLVVTTAPRLPDGTPFPTLYYLTHPGLAAALSRLEADGKMREMNERLVHDPKLAAAYSKAHQSYLADRAAVAEAHGIDDPRELAGISAGGMPTRVKCLHALAAHSLAKGPGINPLGDQALAAINYNSETCLCA